MGLIKSSKMLVNKLFFFCFFFKFKQKYFNSTIMGRSIFHEAIDCFFQDASKRYHLQRTYLKNVSLFKTSSLELLTKFPSFEEMKEFLASKTPKTHISAQKYFQLKKNKVICLLSFYEILYEKNFEVFVTLNFE